MSSAVRDARFVVVALYRHSKMVVRSCTCGGVSESSLDPSLVMHANGGEHGGKGRGPAHEPLQRELPVDVQILPQLQCSTVPSPSPNAAPAVPPPPIVNNGQRWQEGSGKRRAPRP